MAGAPNDIPTKTPPPSIPLVTVVKSHEDGRSGRMRANRYISMPSAAKAMPNPVRRKRQQYFEKPRSDAIASERDSDARTVLPYLFLSKESFREYLNTETDRI